jgi:restriction system protein
MAVPKFQSWFLPFLKLLEDGNNHRLSELYQVLADQFELSEEDRSEMLPSGKQLKYHNRIGWSRTYLKKAGLVESPVRGECRITNRGLEVLAQNYEHINVRFLKQFPEFIEFHTHNPSLQKKSDDVESDETDETPEELLEKSHRTIRDNTTQELLERVKNAPPSFFESLVVDLLLKMGYGGSLENAGQTVGRSGDGGIDGIINEDRLGLDVVCIQAKRWEGTVGRQVVQAFAGSLEGARARKGVLITTSNFSNKARHYVSQIEKRIVLVDGEQLAGLMFEHNLGVSPVAAYEIKRIDTDFFEES